MGNLTPNLLLSEIKQKAIGTATYGLILYVILIIPLSFFCP